MGQWCDVTTHHWCYYTSLMLLHIKMMWLIHDDTTIHIGMSQWCDVMRCDALRCDVMQCDALHCDASIAMSRYTSEWVSDVLWLIAKPRHTSEWCDSFVVIIAMRVVHESYDSVDESHRNDSFMNHYNVIHLWYMNESHRAMWFIHGDTLRSDSFTNHCDVIHSRDHVMHPFMNEWYEWMISESCDSFIHGDSLQRDSFIHGWMNDIGMIHDIVARSCIHSCYRNDSFMNEWIISEWCDSFMVIHCETMIHIARHHDSNALQDITIAMHCKTWR